MSELRVDNIVSADGTAAPIYTQGVIVGSGKTLTVRGDVDFQSGANVSGAVTFSSVNITSGFNVTGVVTATGFSGPLIGNVIGNADTASTATASLGLTGSPNITVTNVSAQDIQVGGALTVTGNETVSGNLTVTNDATVGGALTVTGNFTVNGTTTTIDTVNLVVEDKNIGIGTTASPSNTTADGGGLTIFGGSDGDKTFTWNDATPDYWALGGGYLQVPGLDVSSLLREGANITAGKLSDNTNIDLENGMAHYFTTTETTTSTPNIRYNASTSLNSVMNVGEVVCVTLITTAAAAAYSANITIDGSAVTENWIGGSAPSDGGSSGVDIHTFTIIKTADATFTVIGNQSKTS